MSKHVKAKAPSDKIASAKAGQETNEKRDRPTGRRERRISRLGLARLNGSLTAVYVILSVPTRDGRRIKVAVRPSLLRNRRAIIDRLDNIGAVLPPDPTVVLDFASPSEPDERIDGALVTDSGWFEDAFLFRGKIYQPKAIDAATNAMRIFTCAQFDSDADLNVVDTYDEGNGAFLLAGSVDGWKAEVATWLGCSSIGMTFVAAAFAATLLTLFGFESFGLMATGRSSSGKSTLLKGTASIIGIGAKTGIQTFNATDGALEVMATRHKDLPLIIDEVASIQGGDKARYTFAKRLTYLTDRPTRGRMRLGAVAATGLPTGQAPPRNVVLTTSEHSVAALAAKAGERPDPGQYARLMDIPVGPGPEGVFDRLPKGLSPNQRAKLAADLPRRIIEGAARHHGRVLVAWIKAVLNPPSIKKRDDFIQARMRYFVSQAKPMPGTTEGRRCQHFALAYAAGAYAIEVGLLPWSRKNLSQSLLWSYRAHVEAARSIDAQVGADIERFRNWVEHARIAVWPSRRGPKVDQAGFDGWSRVEDERDIVYVRAKLPEAEFGNRWPMIRDALIEQGILLAEGGKTTVQPRVRGANDRPYCIRVVRRPTSPRR